jgi:phosphate transport system protein
MMSELRESFANELKKLEDEVMGMGNAVKKMLTSTISAYRAKDEAKLEAVVPMDDEVDKYNLAIETRCLELIALQQPMAKDLRTIASIMRLIGDIERVGDYTVDIAKFLKRMLRVGPVAVAEKIFGMEKMVEKMLDEALRAFTKKDLALITQMIKDDDIVDNTLKEVFEGAVQEINKNPALARSAIYAILVARYLERAADHITNVGERIYYMETGVLKELHY